MLEADLLPPEPAPVVADQPREIDARGGAAVLVVMAVVGVLALRPAPGPDIPVRVACFHSEPWMVDALPGIGVRTRERYQRVVRDGEVLALPERARQVAAQVFTWPEASRHVGLPSVP